MVMDQTSNGSRTGRRNEQPNQFQDGVCCIFVNRLHNMVIQQRNCSIVHVTHVPVVFHEFIIIVNKN